MSIPDIGSGDEIVASFPLRAAPGGRDLDDQGIAGAAA